MQIVIDDPRLGKDDWRIPERFREKFDVMTSEQRALYLHTIRTTTEKYLGALIAAMLEPTDEGMKLLQRHLTAFQTVRLKTLKSDDGNRQEH